MNFICAETSLSRLWTVEGALLFISTVLHPPTQVGQEVSLPLPIFVLKAGSNKKMLPWAAGLTAQPATGSDEKRNPIELTNQGLADDAVRPYNCRHLKKVGLGTLEKVNLQKTL